MAGALKLRAEDAEDLKVVSAMLQDAIVPMCDLAWLAGEGAFVLIANRFKWEGAGPDRPRTGPTPDVDMPFERTNCAVRFLGVGKVAYRNMDLHDRKRMLNLLAVEAQDGAVLLHFADGAAIRLETPMIRCVVEDIGEPWPTGSRPCHQDDADIDVTVPAAAQ